MSNKKSYMNTNLLSEGFFDKIAKFLRLRPKLDSKKKKNVSNKLKRNVGEVNRAVDKFEDAIKKHLGDDYPNLPRFKPEDFLR